MRRAQQRPIGYTVTFAPQPPSKRRAWPVRAWRWVRRNRLWLIPLTVPCGLSLTAQVVHHAAWWVRFATIVLAVLTAAAVVIGAPDRWDRTAEVRFARATAAGIAAWLIAGILWGAWNTLMTWTLGGLWTVWTGCWWWHKRPRRQDKVIAGWDLQWQLIIHRMRPKPLTNSHVIDVDAGDNVDSLLIKLDRGRQDIADLRAAGESILSAWEYPEETTFRVSKHGGNRNWAWFHIQHANPLTERREWDEDLAPSSFHDEFIVGFTPEGGLIKTLMRKAHWFIIGMTQWGKSTWLGQLVAQLGKCDDTLIWFIDLKGGGTLGPWRKIIDWAATTHDEAEEMLAAGVRIIKARNAVTDAHEPSPEDPAIVIIVDEANEAWGQGTGTSKLVSLGISIASLGAGMSVHLVAATQIGGLSSMGDERIRGNMAKCMAFRPEKDEHAQYALADWAQLNASKLDEAGMFYFKDEHRPSVLGRGFWLSRPQRARLASLYADRRPVLPEVLAQHAGEAYLTRHERGAAAKPLPQPVKETTMRTPAEIAADIENDLPEPVSAAQMAALNEARRADGLASLTAEKAAQTGEDRFIAELQAGPRSPKQLIEASGMSKSWVQGMLPQLVKYGAVRQAGPREPYEAVPGMNIREAIAEIRSDRRKLEAKARALVDA